MRRTLVRWVTGLCCVLVAPVVLQNAQVVGQALVPPPANVGLSFEKAGQMSVEALVKWPVYTRRCDRGRSIAADHCAQQRRLGLVSSVGTDARCYASRKNTWVGSSHAF
jgi:hypothetical protein